jgi:uncharacterized protein (TIGR04255 family)
MCGTSTQTATGVQNLAGSDYLRMMAKSGNHPRYRKPPIIEVVLAFQFRPSPRPWDSVYFGKLHDRMGAVVSLPNIQGIQGTEITIGPEGAAVQSTELTKRFASADNGLVVTVGPGMLGVSVLPKNRKDGHPGWSNLLQTGLRLLPIYQEVVRPSGIHQIGVRYVNVLAINTEQFQLDRYITNESGYVPPKFSNLRGPFDFRFDYASIGDDLVGREALRIAAHPNPSGGGQLVVDIDEIVSSNVANLSDRIKDLCEDLHDRAWSVFDSVFTRGVREGFEAEPVTSGATA